MNTIEVPIDREHMGGLSPSLLVKRRLGRCARVVVCAVVALATVAAVAGPLGAKSTNDHPAEVTTSLNFTKVEV
jgi:hypothetical protein